MKENQELNLAFDFVHYTNRNIFLTGKAGTGKTTFLHKLKEISPKRMVVVAPTGVAAINARGVTIHSFFQMPFGPILPDRLTNENRISDKNRFIHKFSKKKINIIKTLDLLVIDEISMVRADLLDGIDQVLRRYKNKNLPFGGIQLLMIGDLQQLAPVVKQDEWKLLRNYYDTMFFFSSRAFQKSEAITIELKHIYRQQDNKFIKILNEVRNDSLTEGSIQELNKRFSPNFSPKKEDGYITLTTHNAGANRINEQQLQKLSTSNHVFEAEVHGNFTEYSFPADQYLSLKVGAQVMFVKNDSSYEKRYYNGKIGTVADIDDDLVFVQCEDESEPIAVDREMWENIKYTINNKSKEIEEEVAGTFIQYPLRLAWAITIHKSQGLTFEKAVIDARAAFAHGQTYVALSRCKTLEGLVLISQITSSGIILDKTVNTFNKEVESNQPDQKVLQDSERLYQMALMEELFSYHRIQYQLEKCRKIVDENANSLLGNMPETLREMLEKGSRVLIEVGGKFITQLKQIDRQDSHPESSTTFQERIKKASVYFLENTEKHLLVPLDGSAYETDNKAVDKAIKEVLLKLREMLAIKKACLISSKEGFMIKDFLHARAVASILDLGTKVSRSEPVVKTSTDHPVLFDRLKVWRNEMANEEDVAHYRIASQKLLIGISNALPGGHSQLLALKGMGPKKLDQYGVAILSMVQDYCNENNLPITTVSEKGGNKPSMKHTREISMELFQEGKAIEEIAAIRNFTIQTIEGHLVHYIGTGDLELDSFVPKKISSVIQEFFIENPDARLGEAKEMLDDGITWSMLKFVRKYMEFLDSP